MTEDIPTIQDSFRAVKVENGIRTEANVVLETFGTGEETRTQLTVSGLSDEEYERVNEFAGEKGLLIGSDYNPSLSESLVKLKARGYKIKRFVNRGRFGAIYECEKDGNRFAVKIHNPDDVAKEIMQRDNITLEKILMKESIGFEASHHNIAFRIAMEEFLLMPLYEKDLERYAVENSPDNERKLNITRQIIHGLSYAHTRLERVEIDSNGEEHRTVGRIHRDLKLDNILIDSDGNAYITDFGCSSNVCTEARTDSPRDKLGSMLTSAPERFLDGNRGNKRSDVFSLGAVIGKLYTGEYPLEKRIRDSSDARKELAQIGRYEFEGIIRDYVEGLPKELREFVRVALSYSPEARYKDASDMETEFKRVLKEVEGNQPLSRLKKAIVGVSAGAVLLGGLIFGTIYESTTKRLEEQVQTQSERIELSDKLKIISLYIQKKENGLPISHQATTRDDYAEEGKLLGYIKRFEDERTAFAAYLNPRAVVCAIKTCKSERYSQIGDMLCKIDPKTFYELENHVSTWRFPSSATADFSMQERREKNKRVSLTEIQELESEYSRLQELEEIFKPKFDEYKERCEKHSKDPSNRGNSWQPMDPFERSLDTSEKENYCSLIELRKKFYHPEISGGNRK